MRRTRTSVSASTSAGPSSSSSRVAQNASSANTGALIGARRPTLGASTSAGGYSEDERPFASYLPSAALALLRATSPASSSSSPVHSRPASRGDNRQQQQQQPAAVVQTPTPTPVQGAGVHVPPPRRRVRRTHTSSSAVISPAVSLPLQHSQPQLQPNINHELELLPVPDLGVTLADNTTATPTPSTGPELWVANDFTASPLLIDSAPMPAPHQVSLGFCAYTRCADLRTARAKQERLAELDVHLNFDEPDGFDLRMPAEQQVCLLLSSPYQS